MRKKLWLIPLALLLVISLVAIGCLASPEPTEPTTPAREKAIIHWATLSVGATNYEESVGMAEVIKKYTAVMDVKIEPTVGDTAWIPMLEAGEVDFACQSATGAAWAYKGISKQWEKPHTSLRVVLEGAPLIYAVITRSDSGIKTIADLRGKSVADPVGVYYMRRQLLALLEANGMTEDDLDIRDYATIGEMNADLINGRVDAIHWALSPFLIELEATRGAYVIPYTEEEQETVERRCFGIKAITSPEGLYGIPATPLTFAPGTVFTRADQGEEVVYEITKAIYEHTDELSTYGPTLKGYHLSNFNSLVFCPYHPGAIKYYKEKGVWTNEMEQLQQEMLAAE